MHGASPDLPCEGSPSLHLVASSAALPSGAQQAVALANLLTTHGSSVYALCAPAPIIVAGIQCSALFFELPMCVSCSHASAERSATSFCEAGSLAACVMRAQGVECMAFVLYCLIALG
jgi:hypothetical protein